MGGRGGREGTGRVDDVGPTPTWYSAGCSSRLWAGLRRLRDRWAKALDSARDGRGSHSWGEEGGRGWLEVRCPSLI